MKTVTEFPGTLLRQAAEIERSTKATIKTDTKEAADEPPPTANGEPRQGPHSEAAPCRRAAGGGAVETAPEVPAEGTSEENAAAAPETEAAPEPEAPAAEEAAGEPSEAPAAEAAEAGAETDSPGETAPPAEESAGAGPVAEAVGTPSRSAAIGWPA